MSSFITQEFPPVSAAAWKQKIQVDLKGADYNETLLSKTNEGITIKPFYHADDFEKLTIPLSKEDFKICQKIPLNSIVISQMEQSSTSNSCLETNKSLESMAARVDHTSSVSDLLFGDHLSSLCILEFEFDSSILFYK